MQHQRLRVEAEIGPIGADHPQGVDAGGQARQIAVLDGFQVMLVDGAALGGCGQCLAAALALALQEPPRLASRIDVAIGLLPKQSTLMLLHGGLSAAHRTKRMP